MEDVRLIPANVIIREMSLAWSTTSCAMAPHLQVTLQCTNEFGTSNVRGERAEMSRRMTVDAHDMRTHGQGTLTSIHSNYRMYLQSLLRFTDLAPYNQ